MVCRAADCRLPQVVTDTPQMVHTDHVRLLQIVCLAAAGPQWNFHHQLLYNESAIMDVKYEDLLKDDVANVTWSRLIAHFKA